MKAQVINNGTKVDQKEQGGPFSHFQISAGAVLIKAFGEIMTAMKEVESLFNKMAMASIELQCISSEANASAAKKSLELEANQMRTQGWTSIATGAAAFANTAADLYLSYQSSKTADGIGKEREPLNEEIKNAEAYKKAFRQQRNLNMGENKNQTGEVTNDKIQEIIDDADKRVKTPISKTEKKTIKLSKSNTEAKDGIEAYDQVINDRRAKLKELQDKLTQANNKFQQIQTIFGNMRGWTSDLPNSIASFLNEAKKRLQGVEEKLKILSGSITQLDQSMQSKAEQSYNSAVQRLNELAQQFKELTSADAYRG